MLHDCSCNADVPNKAGSTAPTSPVTVKEYVSDDSVLYVMEHWSEAWAIQILCSKRQISCAIFVDEMRSMLNHGSCITVHVLKSMSVLI